MNFFVTQARSEETYLVSEILLEAISWLDAQGMSLWRHDEVMPDTIQSDVDAGLFYLAWDASQAVGTLKYQLEDELFWSDVPRGESAFIHKLAVRRGYSGGVVSYRLLEWAVEKSKSQGLKYLRLDCDASRPQLCTIYENFGFQKHSTKQVGLFYVMRFEYSLSGGLTAI
ncbi:GNAT family acetyltransferase [Scytonema hofmannii PCC 7110]|uniref:GNAT family acetyltransferase n=1 Tax=Scytonema hofmannii PCC 7110 TaxID=128403 RepID=A0A139WWF3_9CYAN|nr:GNAT family N-acetyltransferase [Scytonema hofmannii]KYC36768.1 GNAT family acetyltransferase [Scytonema hofmannii PCC 7110]